MFPPRKKGQRQTHRPQRATPRGQRSRAGRKAGKRRKRRRARILKSLRAKTRSSPSFKDLPSNCSLPRAMKGEPQGPQSELPARLQEWDSWPLLPPCSSWRLKRTTSLRLTRAFDGTGPWTTQWPKRRGCGITD